MSLAISTSQLTPTPQTRTSASTSSIVPETNPFLVERPATWGAQTSVLFQLPSDNLGVIAQMHGYADRDNLRLNLLQSLCAKLIQTCKRGSRLAIQLCNALPLEVAATHGRYQYERVHSYFESKRPHTPRTFKTALWFIHAQCPSEPLKLDNFFKYKEDIFNPSFLGSVPVLGLHMSLFDLEPSTIDTLITRIEKQIVLFPDKNKIEKQDDLFSEERPSWQISIYTKPQVQAMLPLLALAKSHGNVTLVPRWTQSNMDVKILLPMIENNLISTLSLAIGQIDAAELDRLAPAIRGATQIKSLDLSCENSQHLERLLAALQHTSIVMLTVWFRKGQVPPDSLPDVIQDMPCLKALLIQGCDASHPNYQAAFQAMDKSVFATKQ